MRAQKEFWAVGLRGSRICFEWWCDSFGAGKVQKGRLSSLAARKQIYANALKIPARTKRLWLFVRVYKLKCTLEGARTHNIRRQASVCEQTAWFAQVLIQLWTRH